MNIISRQISFKVRRHLFFTVLPIFTFMLVNLISCASRYRMGTNNTHSETILYHNLTYDCYIINLNQTQLHLYWKRPTGEKFINFGALKLWLESKNQTLIFATNAGIYEPGCIPTGLHVESGCELVPLNLADGYGNFYLKPNAVFYISEKGAGIVESKKWIDVVENIILATQSGPALVLNGKIHSRFKEESNFRCIRGGVGVIDNNRIVFAISNEEVNLYEFAMFFKGYFGCNDALYLDGANSEMYCPELGRNDLFGQFAGIFAITE